MPLIALRQARYEEPPITPFPQNATLVQLHDYHCDTAKRFVSLRTSLLNTVTDILLHVQKIRAIEIQTAEEWLNLKESYISKDLRDLLDRFFHKDIYFDESGTLGDQFHESDHDDGFQQGDFSVKLYELLPTENPEEATREYIATRGGALQDLQTEMWQIKVDYIKEGVRKARDYAWDKLKTQAGMLAADTPATPEPEEVVGVTFEEVLPTLMFEHLPCFIVREYWQNSQKEKPTKLTDSASNGWGSWLYRMFVGAGKD